MASNSTAISNITQNISVSWLGGGSLSASGGVLTISSITSLVLSGNLTLGTAALQISGTTGSQGITLAGTNQSFTITPSGTGNLNVATGNVILANTFYSGKDASNNVTYNGQFLQLKAGQVHQFIQNGTEIARFAVTSGNLLLGRLTTDGTGVLQFPAATTSAGGITFGADVNIYRDGANGLRYNATGATVLVGWGIGGTRKNFLYFDGTDSTLGTDTGKLIFASGAGITALTLDSSQNATFAGNANLTGTKLANFGATAAASIGVSADTTAGVFTFNAPSAGSFAFGSGAVAFNGALSGITTLSASGVITSTLATGTAPFTVASTTVVGNLNVSQLLGATWAAPGTIGSGTPNTGAFTTLSATTSVGVNGGTGGVLNVKQTGNSISGGFRTIRSDTADYSTFYMGGDNNLYFDNRAATGGFQWYLNSSQLLQLSSTSLAVTGALSTTGAITVALAGMNSTVKVGQSSTATGYGAISFNGATNIVNLLGFNGGGTADNTLYVAAPSGGGVSMRVAGTSVSEFTATGLAVTGSISSTAAISYGAATDGAFSAIFAGNALNGIQLRDSTDTSGAVFAAFRNGSATTIGSISRVTTTNAVTYNTTSDERMKWGFRPFDKTEAARLIDLLEPSLYNWKDEGEGDDHTDAFGFSAQRTYAADKRFARWGAVTVGDFGETIEKQWQRCDTALIPLIVSDAQNTHDELAALRARVAELEAKLAA